jgi:hypothetical protein
MPDQLVRKPVEVSQKQMQEHIYYQGIVAEAMFLLERHQIA